MSAETNTVAVNVVPITQKTAYLLADGLYARSKTSTEVYINVHWPLMGICEFLVRMTELRGGGREQLTTLRTVPLLSHTLGARWCGGPTKLTRASLRREKSLRQAHACGVRVDECGEGMVVVGEEELFRLDSGRARGVCDMRRECPNVAHLSRRPGELHNMSCAADRARARVKDALHAYSSLVKPLTSGIGQTGSGGPIREWRRVQVVQKEDEGSSRVTSGIENGQDWTDI